MVGGREFKTACLTTEPSNAALCMRWEHGTTWVLNGYKVLPERSALPSVSDAIVDFTKARHLVDK